MKNRMNGKASVGWDAPIGAVDLKTIVALVFALAGLTWAVISLIPTGTSDDQAPRIIASALDNDGNAVDTDYTKANSSKRIESVSAEVEEAVASQAASALASITAPKGIPDGVSEAVVNAFIPILAGDHDSFVDAIIAMGGKIAGDLDEDHMIFKQLVKVFEHARVDLSRITVSKYESGQGRMGMRRREVTEDVEIEPGQQSMPQVRSSVMEMQPASLFPDAPSKEDPTAIEVKIPVQPAGEKDESVFSLILTWNTQSKLWQPAAYRVIKNRLMEED